MRLETLKFTGQELEIKSRQRAIVPKYNSSTKAELYFIYQNCSMYTAKLSAGQKREGMRKSLLIIVLLDCS